MPDTEDNPCENCRHWPPSEWCTRNAHCSVYGERMKEVRENAADERFEREHEGE